MAEKDPGAAIREFVAAFVAPVPELMSQAELHQLAREVAAARLNAFNDGEVQAWETATVSRLLGHIAALSLADPPKPEER